jgi:hypothetical protein
MLASIVCSSVQIDILWIDQFVSDIYHEAEEWRRKEPRSVWPD